MQAGDAPILREQAHDHGKEQETDYDLLVFDLTPVLNEKPDADEGGKNGTLQSGDVSQPGSRRSAYFP